MTENKKIEPDDEEQSRRFLEVAEKIEKAQDSPELGKLVSAILRVRKEKPST